MTTIPLDAIDPEAERIERWRAVVGYEGAYEVSNLGRVRSVARTDARGHRQEGMLLKIGRHPRGYEQIRLYRAGQGESKKVHHLVLEAFVGPMPNGMEGCHRNGVRHDNRIGNLRWDTVRENANDRMRHHPTCRRGHLLEGPNLLIVGSKRKRQCRVCQRERVRAHDQGRPFDEARADQAYVETMGGVS